MLLMAMQKNVAALAGGLVSQGTIQTVRGT
jgi:hypothetical protein